MLDLERLRELEREATPGDDWPTNHPGQWYLEKHAHADSYTIWADHGDRRVPIADVERVEDAALICAMRNALPELLGEIERLRVERDAAVKDLLDFAGPCCGACKHAQHDKPLSSSDVCKKCMRQKNCDGFYVFPNWQWRGARNEEGVG